MRDDPIHEVCRALGHATAATGGAKPAGLAREQHELVVITVTTLQPREARSHIATAQVRPELTLHMPRQRPLVLRQLQQQLREALGDNRAELFVSFASKLHRPWRTTECEIDLRPGGMFRTVMQGPAGEVSPSVGCYLEVVPQRRLVWTDALGPGYRPSGGGFMTGLLLLEPAGGGTLYTAIVRHANAEKRAEHDAMGFQEGWGAALDQLVAMAHGL